jgi:hypothetical protein
MSTELENQNNKINSSESDTVEGIVEKTVEQTLSIIFNPLPTPSEYKEYAESVKNFPERHFSLVEFQTHNDAETTKKELEIEEKAIQSSLEGSLKIKATSQVFLILCVTFLIGFSLYKEYIGVAILFFGLSTAIFIGTLIISNKKYSQSISKPTPTK